MRYPVHNNSSSQKKQIRSFIFLENLRLDNLLSKLTDLYKNIFSKRNSIAFSCKKLSRFIFNDFMIKWEQETRPKGIEVICIL